MIALRAFLALIVREYREHRIAFLYFPAGILSLIALAALSSLGFNRIHELALPTLPTGLKIFELGDLVLGLLWFFYLGIALFFYFGDAFAADRRNNAMLFWKSMPVSDLRILISKVLAAFTLFPLIIVFVAAISGLLLFLLVMIAGRTLPDLVMPSPFEALAAFGHVTLFVVGYIGLALLWYAPFLAWVGALSTVFGRWSLPLAVVIPALASIVENVALFGQVPTGGYIWNFLKQRWQFGLNELDTTQILVQVQPFDAVFFIRRLAWGINWPSLWGGLVVAAVLIWLASAYRRRRIT